MTDAIWAQYGLLGLGWVIALVVIPFLFFRQEKMTKDHQATLLELIEKVTSALNESAAASKQSSEISASTSTVVQNLITELLRTKQKS